MARALNDILADGVSVSSNYTSNAVELLFLSGYSVAAKFTNSAGLSGCSAYLEGSNRMVQSGGTNIASTDDNDWFEICGSSHAVTGNGKFAWNVVSAQYHWMRLKVDISAGSLTLTAYVNGKSE